jgi:hypothetical protein
MYAPVYADPSTVLKVSIEESKPIRNPWKIVIYRDYLMVNIRNEGFHVIDNRNPEIPRPLYFISIPGNQDVAIKDGVIYADNYGDIVAFQINDNREVEILDRIPGAMENQNYPPFTNVYFECVDPEKGYVIDWVKADVENPKCRR